MMCALWCRNGHGGQEYPSWATSLRLPCAAACIPGDQIGAELLRISRAFASMQDAGLEAIAVAWMQIRRITSRVDLA